MTTVFKEGTLVKVFSWDKGSYTFGVIRDYRPGVLGGSQMMGQGSNGKYYNVHSVVPSRGEVLVFTYHDGGLGWLDEASVATIE